MKNDLIINNNWFFVEFRSECVIIILYQCTFFYVHVYIYIYNWLVVTGTMEFYDFPFSWEVHHPNWRTQIFQRGRYTTTRWSLNHRWLLNPSGKHTKNDGKSQLFIEKYIISMAMFNSEVSKMTRGLSSHWRLDRKLQPESHGSFPSQLSSLW